MSNQNEIRFCGNGKVLTNKEGEYFGLKFSICFDDITNEDLQTAKNGKRYLNLAAIMKPEVDNYGNDHYIKFDDYHKRKAAEESRPVPKGPQLANDKPAF